MQDFSASKNYVNSLFLSSFSTLKDPRRQSTGNFRHQLMDMIFLVISGVVSGSDDWEHIETFGKSQLNWLRRFAPFKNGIPSHDTLGRVFSAIDFEKLSECFVEWTQSISHLTPGEVIAIDGKRLRGSHDKANGKKAIHMVSAFACTNGISLGQVVTDKKSNEITAIPKLLELLAIKGCTVTIDAMGCQKDIASKILSKEANYILAIKENQAELYAQTTKLFSITQPTSFYETVDTEHNRVETRRCDVLDDFTFFDDKEQWPGAKTLIRISSERYNKLTTKTETETRYYLSSCEPVAKVLNQSIRDHWKIENNLHWVLDVRFNEDKNRKRTGQSAANFNVLTKVALAFLKETPTNKKMSLSRKRYNAALSTDFREKVLNI